MDSYSFELITKIVANLVRLGLGPEEIETFLGDEQGLQSLLQYIRGGKTLIDTPVDWITRTKGPRVGAHLFTVDPDGVIGPEWLEYFARTKVKLQDWAARLIEADGFSIAGDWETNEDKTWIEVLNTSLIAQLQGGAVDLGHRAVRKLAAELGMKTPKAEVACLIRKRYSMEQIRAMGFRHIIVMHEPIKDPSDGQESLIGVGWDSSGAEVHGFYAKSGSTIPPGCGVAFLSKP